MKYNLAVLGGTFDHLHKGHKEFLRFCFSLSEKLLIGLTSDDFAEVKNKFKNIENYRERENNLKKFFKEEHALERVSIVSIRDIYIPKEWEGLPIGALIVSEDTIAGAKKINIRRKEQKKAELPIEVFKMVRSQDNGYINSSSIRGGKITRVGGLCVDPLWLTKDLAITDALREVLKKPIGVFIKDDDKLISFKAPVIATVGDVTSSKFNRLGVERNISVIDFNVARHRKFFSIEGLGFKGDEDVVRINNLAGKISHGVFEKLISLSDSFMKKKTIFLIDGEEDLVVLPLILILPLNSLIFYGQPQEGLVMITVSEEIKKTAYEMVRSFNVL